MAPLIALVASFGLFRLVGMVVPYFAAWPIALRAALGVMFLLTASAHWGERRPDLIRMVPRAFPHPGILVSLTGVAELLIALGLQVPQAASVTAAIAVVMLLCIFPANVKAARERLTIGGRNVPGLVVRSTIQIIFIAALVAAGWPN